MGANEKLLNELVEAVFKEGASDLHIAEGRSPVIRVSNFLIPLVKIPVISKEDMNSILNTFLSLEQKKEFDNTKEINFAYSHNPARPDDSGHSGGGKERFRCNAYQTLGKTNVAMRLVPTSVKTFAELNLPSILKFCQAATRVFLGCWADRGRQIHYACHHDRDYQPRALGTHHHHRRSYRIYLRTQEGDHRPARSETRYAQFPHRSTWSFSP